MSAAPSDRSWDSAEGSREPEETPTGRRVLVVDDEVDIIELLRDALGGAGYRVDGATSGQAALQLVHEAVYDAVILDFSLPDMNGITLHARLRRIDKELAERSVFISGYEQTDSQMDYYLFEGKGFIRKPFDVAEVLEKIDDLTRHC